MSSSTQGEALSAMMRPPSTLKGAIAKIDDPSSLITGLASVGHQSNWNQAKKTQIQSL